MEPSLTCELNWIGSLRCFKEQHYWISFFMLSSKSQPEAETGLMAPNVSRDEGLTSKFIIVRHDAFRPVISLHFTLSWMKEYVKMGLDTKS